MNVAYIASKYKRLIALSTKCGKIFYYGSFVLNQKRLHTGEFKECICDLCGAVYKSVQVLNKHKRMSKQVYSRYRPMP